MSGHAWLYGVLSSSPLCIKHFTYRATSQPPGGHSVQFVKQPKGPGVEFSTCGPMEALLVGCRL